MADIFDLETPSLFSLLPEATRAALHAAATPVHYRDGVLVHGRGDRKPGLSVVTEGRVRVGNPGADGSYTTSSILGPGHCFGEFTLFADLPRTHDVVAIGAVTIDQIAAPRVMALYHADPAFGLALLRLATRRLHAVMEFIEDLRRLPLKVQLGVLSRNRRKFRQPINVACPAPGRWGRPNSRVTSRHFDHGNASRTSRPDCSGLDEAD